MWNAVCTRLFYICTPLFYICIHLFHRSFSAWTSQLYVVGRFFYRGARSHQLSAPERRVELCCTSLFYRFVRLFYRSLSTIIRLFGVCLALLDHINFRKYHSKWDWLYKSLFGVTCVTEESRRHHLAAPERGVGSVGIRSLLQVTF